MLWTKTCFKQCNMCYYRDVWCKNTCCHAFVGICTPMTWRKPVSYDELSFPISQDTEVHFKIGLQILKEHNLLVHSIGIKYYNIAMKKTIDKSTMINTGFLLMATQIMAVGEEKKNYHMEGWTWKTYNKDINMFAIHYQFIGRRIQFLTTHFAYARL